MGLYDRDYIREEDQRPLRLGGYSMVTNLIIVNVAIFIIDVFSPEKGLGQRWLSDLLSVEADAIKHPWQWWQFLTAGFAHDPSNIMHVGFNMFALWMFGRDVEAIYGRNEFLRLYLALVVFSFVVWSAFETLGGGQARALGASGAVAGVLVLFALHYPKRTLLLFFVIPVPAWAVAMGMVVLDLLGATRPGENVAHAAHLAGAALAFAYRAAGWNFGRLVPARFSWRRFRLRPKLRIHKPAEREQDLSAQVDRILEKISREGEASLTKQERRTLEDASRRYQQRRK